MSKIKVSTIRETADTEVIRLNSAIIANIVRSRITLEQAVTKLCDSIPYQEVEEIAEEIVNHSLQFLKDLEASLEEEDDK